MNKEIENPVKVKIKGEKEGFKIVLKSKVTPDQAVSFTNGLIEDLKKNGVKTEVKDALPDNKPTEAAVPMCPTHNKEMVQRQGQYGNFWACPTKENGEWCKYHPKK
jgi:hypothetical protein